ncbi:MAG: tRNA (guanosine(46)-N7)-methyltransferase TrmB [Flavobacteriales bacterium]|nr:tRNA (guanosine(46)-N7)-methyltransferase TrmB [Flavobacteriales bacterium]
MPKKKHSHFAEMKTFACIYEPENEEMTRGDNTLKGAWNSGHFRKDKPITLELGCGKGEYAVAMGQRYPERHFVGVDIKGARLWRGAKTVDEEGIDNVAFLIWLTFSDPQPKDKKETKRLTGKHFLKRYACFLKPGGLIHVKTDSVFLYESTLATIEEGGHTILFQTDDVYGEGIERLDDDRRELLQIKTFYEQKFLAREMPIHYLCFTLNDSLYKNS